MTHMWEIFIEYRNKLEFMSKNKMPRNLLYGFIHGSCIMCIYQAYTRLCQECLSLSIYSNIVQPIRPRHNFSFFAEVSPISSNSVLLILGCSSGAVKHIFAQAAPRSFRSELLWGGIQASIFLRSGMATVCSRD